MGGFAYFGGAFAGPARQPWSALLHSMTFRAGDLTSPIMVRCVVNQWLEPLLDATRHAALHQGCRTRCAEPHFFGPRDEGRI